MLALALNAYALALDKLESCEKCRDKLALAVARLKYLVVLKPLTVAQPSHEVNDSAVYRDDLVGDNARKCLLGRRQPSFASAHRADIALDDIRR